MATIELGEGNNVRLLIPYGGPEDRDLDREWFDAATDFRLGWPNSTLPLLWHHGLDPAGPRTDSIGKVDKSSATPDPDGAGLWFDGVLDKRNRYVGKVRDLIKRGALGASSGAVAHLIEIESSGRIKSWPLVELSLTPTPSYPGHTVEFATASKHYKAAGLPELPPVGEVLGADVPPYNPLDPEQPDESGRVADDYAYASDADGARALPLDTPESCAASLEAFGGTRFESSDKAVLAARKLRDACALFGMEIPPDHPVMRWLERGKATLTADERDELARADFADPEHNGLPIHDAAHVRAALARFDQYQWSSAAAKQRGARRILAAARRLNIDVAEDSMVMEASKSWERTYSLGRRDLLAMKILRLQLELDEMDAAMRPRRVDRKAKADADLLRLRLAEDEVPVLDRELRQLREWAAA